MAAPAHVARENGKKGGRPKGSKNQATLDKEAALSIYRGKIVGIADKLFIAQTTLALGQSYLYKVEKTRVGHGKNSWIKKERPIQVTNQLEIQAYLEGLVEDGDLEDPEATYYYITTVAPDGRAIDSMQDRVWGRPTQAIEHTIEPFTVDDIRALIAALPSERQQYFYDLITGIIAEAELSRSRSEVQGDGSDKSRNNKN